MVMRNTGAPQGTVPPPFLFTTYTSDVSYNYEMCHLQKLMDDSSILAYIDSEEELRGVGGAEVCCSEKNHVILNISETKEW